MSPRAVAFLLMCVEAIALAVLGKSLAFPAFAVVASVIAMTSLWQPKLNGRRLFFTIGSIALAFLGKYYLIPANPSYEWGSFRIQAGLIICQFLMTLQLLHLFCVRATTQGLAVAAFPGLGAVALVCASVVRAPAKDRLVLQLLFVAFALLSAIYAARTRRVVAVADRGLSRRRFVAMSLICTAVGVLGWIGAQSLYRFERQIDDFVTSILQPDGQTNRIGFSGMARLGSVQHQKSTASNKVAIRVFSEQRPGYLRGKSFDELTGTAWSSNLAQLSLEPATKTPANCPEFPSGHRLFAPSDVTAEKWQFSVCWPDPSYDRIMFAPLGTTHVTASVPEVAVDRDRIYLADDLLPGRPYATLVPTKGAEGDFQDIEFEPLLRLPDNLDPRIDNLANTVFAGHETAVEKIEAVRDHFASKYKYSLSISIPEGEDALTYFLFERPAAHCEYFATATAILLRKAGIPCRYVTGFVAAEKHEYGDYWIARNRDAHAWVEAFDEELGWITVESTPSAGVPDGTSPSSKSQWWESVKAEARMALVRLQEGGIPALTELFGRILTSWPVLSLGIALLAYRIVVLVRRRRRSQQIRRHPEFRELHRLLALVDAKLRKAKLERLPGETLNQFAERIEPNPMADWYREYVTIRYTGELQEEQVERFVAQTAQLSNRIG